jgi:hypothetical protein
MRHLTLPLLALLVLAPQTTQAQDAPRERQTGFMMMNQHVCPLQGLGRVHEITDTYITPIFEEMRQAGEIRSWGFLDHAWGDEWNFNFYVITENRETFFNAWNSFMRRAEERHPGIGLEFASLCTMHRDNLYVVRDHR